MAITTTTMKTKTGRTMARYNNANDVNDVQHTIGEAKPLKRRDHDLIFFVGDAYNALGSIFLAKFYRPGSTASQATNPYLTPAT